MSATLNQLSLGKAGVDHLVSLVNELRKLDVAAFEIGDLKVTFRTNPITLPPPQKFITPEEEQAHEAEERARIKAELDRDLYGSTA